MSAPSQPETTFEPHPGQGFIHIRVRGTFGFDEARVAVGHVVAQNPNLNRLWDFREASLMSWNADEVRAFNALVRGPEDAGRYERMAALVTRDVEYGIGRMYEMMSEGSFSPEHAVFRDETKAVEWVSARTPAPRGRSDEPGG